MVERVQGTYKDDAVVIGSTVVSGIAPEQGQAKVYSKEIGGGVQPFRNITDRDTWTALFPALAVGSFALVKNGNRINAYEWTGTAKDGSDGSWQAISLSSATEATSAFSEGFLSYFSESQPIIDMENPSNKTVVIYPDDVKIGMRGKILNIDDRKSWRLDADNGSEDFIFALNLRIKGDGVANDGDFTCSLVDRATGNAIVDLNGYPITKTVHVNHAVGFDSVRMFTIFNLKASTEVQLQITSMGIETALRVPDGSDGRSCVLFQEITDNQKTSIALLQFEIDTGITVDFFKHNLDGGLAHNAWTGKNQDATTLAGGQSLELGEFSHLHAVSDLQYDFFHGELSLRPAHPSGDFFWTYETILDNRTSIGLAGKMLRVAVPYNYFQGALMLSVAIWRGDADKYTQPAITGVASNDDLQSAQDWQVYQIENNTLTDGGISAQFKDFAVEFIVPKGATNMALILSPKSGGITTNVTINGMDISIDDKSSFYTSSLRHTPQIEASEGEITRSHFANRQGSWLTIFDHQTTLSLGTFVSGNAPARLNMTNTDMREFHAPLIFDKSGTVNLSTTVAVHVGWGFPDGVLSSTVRFWYGVGDELATASEASEITESSSGEITLYKSDGGFHEYTINTTLDVKAGDQIWLFGESNLPTGAYLDYNGDAVAKTDVVFTPESDFDVNEIFSSADFSDFSESFAGVKIATIDASGTSATVTVTGLPKVVTIITLACLKIDKDDYSPYSDYSWSVDYYSGEITINFNDDGDYNVTFGFLSNDEKSDP